MNPTATDRSAIERMLRVHLEGRGIRDPRVLHAMATVPRDQFVPSEMRAHAWDDAPLPIGQGQTISQPYIVALMTELAEIEPGDRVLEVGTGCGYQTAVLLQLTPHVYTIEVRPELAEQARRRLEPLGLPPDHLRVGDGSRGWPEHAPFDAILVTAAPRTVPQPLLEQLTPGGRLVIPVGDEFSGQQLLRIRKDQEGGFATESIIPVRFVPLIPEKQTD
ncbi:MAG: protein-L-isoaspartate(D-aspartate) O-methyltransferase [Candidatus Dadabacteria bacterium]|nr:MAG: protein-L-isoaspartate(D-aspartate) O-methyltransferase [Candidatus Dadabacteria bacterium]